MSAFDGKRLVSKWYFGGIAGVGAVCCTHPLDLIRVHIQLQQADNNKILSHTTKIIKKQGFFALYNGLTASILRQMTYSTTRFGIYELGKQHLTPEGKIDISFTKKIFLAGFAGALGGIVGAPSRKVNIRMQNDIKLPPEKRRNYKHVLDGFYKIYRDDGVRKIFSGASMSTTRGIVMTIGQFPFYDQVKVILLRTGIFKDNSITHFLSSLSAGGIATLMTQPLDVLGTRLRNSKPGEYRTYWQLITYSTQLGPLGFLKGFVPAFVRLGSQTIIMFMILEKLRQNYGVYLDS